VAAISHDHPTLDPGPLIIGEHDDASLNAHLLSQVWTPPSRAWWIMLGIALSAVGGFGVAVYLLVGRGIGMWGNNIPVAWAWEITNFVWWIGIGHAGTLISAILLLLQQQWRTSINRFAETMTLFAVTCAGLFPLLHMGRPWFGYWLFPYPSTFGLWPQFRSALTWDVFAVSTYLTISILFWFVGLVPDFASARESSPKLWQRRLYGILALGWRGAAKHWKSYQSSYLILAGLSTPLVVSVHSVVSFDFAIAMEVGWHSTIFPPFFVAGAVFSGFAMVLTLMLPARRFLNLQHFITARHIQAMCKIILVTSWIVTFGYISEHFMTFYGGNRTDVGATLARISGPYAKLYWTMLFCNCLVPQLLWSRRFRDNTVLVWILAGLVNVGMWTERFVIIVTNLSHDFMPSNFRVFHATIIDVLTFVGTLGLFSTLFLLALRIIPIVGISEMKELRHELDDEEARHAA
jgi:molybdopterin-containing oxidoreductase family membrane subunit